ncbi:MAG TPA: DMT family transporter [Ktedonobacteraceae bacterium]
MPGRERTAFLSAIGVLLLAVLCWGLAPVANRYLLRSLSPPHLVVGRFVVASLFFVPLILRMRKQHWSRADLLRAIFCGFASILGYNVAVTYGLEWVSAGMGGLLVATAPLWIALFSRVVEREPLHWTGLVGLALSLGGVATLIGWTALLPEHKATLFWGMGLVLFASMMWAMYTVAVRPLSSRYGAPVSTGFTTIVGTLPLVFLWDPHLLPAFVQLREGDWFAFALLAFGSTVVATMLWNYGVTRLPSTQAGIFLNLLPVVSMGGGSLFLGEHISLNMLLSGVIIVAGVVVTQVPSFAAFQRQKASTSEMDKAETHISQHLKGKIS